MLQPQFVLPDGTIVKYCHTPDPLYATEDGEHIYFILPGIGVCRELPQHVIKPAPTNINYRRKQQYKIVTAPKNTYLVHLLVAAAWHGPHHYPDFECHHLNGIVTDNRAANLIWLTPPEHRRFDAALKQGIILTRVDPSKRMEYDFTHHMEC